MSKSTNTSERFSISVPKDILESYRSCQSMKNFPAFVRVAVIEKMNRDFGFALDTRKGDFSRGSRVDLMDPAEKTKKMPALRRQAEVMRAGKERIKRSREK